jgi:hypothetical protein
MQPSYFRTFEKISILNENIQTIVNISDSGKTYIIDST